jgi:Mg2+ and Co2+ transporter CorA
MIKVRAPAGTLVWVEVLHPTPDELATLGAEFGIHELALKDLQVAERQRPKVEQYQDQVLLVVYGAEAGDGDQPTRLFEVGLIAGADYLLTFHGGAPVDPGPVARRVKARPELASEGIGYLLYVALDELVDTFFPRKELITVRRVVGPTRDAMVVLLRRDLGSFGSESQRHLAIFAVVTMISGIYGMNFHHMPELGWRYGYAWAVGLMVASADALWVYFKRKGWL